MAEQTNASALEVPDRILDMVVERAKVYADVSGERWLGTDPVKAAWIKANATVNMIDTPERRELHRAILLEQALKYKLTGDLPEKPILFYVCGPMAAGKSTLIQAFEDRIAANDENLYADSNIERGFQLYKQMRQRLMKSDFALYKARLPEFAADPANFAIIRPEASGLDQAALAWAGELRTNVLSEQLGDGIEKWAEQQAQTHRLVIIGVKTDRDTNLARLHERNQQRGENISEDELDRTITGFNAADGFAGAARHAEFAVLIDSTGPDYKVIQAFENGGKTYNLAPATATQTPISRPAPGL
jgi:hypothetical protein